MADAPEPSTSGRDHINNLDGKRPMVLIVLGMAGSGKTTLLQRLNAYMHQHEQPYYLINLDPAVANVPYEPNIDIRDTVNYKNVMKEYGLGPNGGILTSLNLFATKFDQVLALCGKPRDPPLQHIVVDTPGQIEIFTWSASGSIITQAFALDYPTALLFVVDTPRCAAPQTFMSNMLQACSILYKSRLPLLLVFNKCDVSRADTVVRWMKDFDAFQEALQKDESYASTLSRSLALVLEEFYEHLQHVAVSAVTGEGIDRLMAAVDTCRAEYETYYKPEMEKRKQEKQAAEAKRQAEQLAKLRLDLADDEATGKQS